jgi:hypothetical protein
MNQCKIGAVYGNSFIEVPTMGSQILKYCEAKSHGFAIDTLTLYEDHKKIGNMSVRKDNFDIHQTIYYPKIYPIVEFIENVMKRSGSAISARSWLRQMGAQYI